MHKTARMAAHAEKAWEWFRSIGSPRLWVAPMVDQSELPFRLLCHRHGADAAYTPMLHSRLFAEDEKYRTEHFTTCPQDRPLLVQFCTNDPATVLAAGRLVQGACDGVDLNLGCPQRIAKRGRYGAFLMDDLPLVQRLVETLAQGLDVPVTVKIRLFPQLEQTLAYAEMLQDAGASLVAVHGRTREQKDARKHRADWDAIKAVKVRLLIPVLANGNVRTLEEAQACLRHTGCDGVMSADPLLVNPALFAAAPAPAWVEAPALRGCALLLEYLDLLQAHPTAPRMVRGHVHKLLGDWLQEHTDVRARITGKMPPIPELRAIVTELAGRIRACGRDHPVPKLSERKLAAMAKEAALQAAVEEQRREEEGLQRLAGAQSGIDAMEGQQREREGAPCLAEAPTVSAVEAGPGGSTTAAGAPDALLQPQERGAAAHIASAADASAGALEVPGSERQQLQNGQGVGHPAPVTDPAVLRDAKVQRTEQADSYAEMQAVAA